MKDGRVGVTLAGRWRLDRRIGSGGVATVFAATDLREHGSVAVKVLHDDLAGDQDIRRRFLREGVVVNRIEHPGVVHVVDAGTDAERTYLVMALLLGKTLKETWHAAGDKLPPDEVIHHVDRILDIVTAAHAAGVLHRDLKADNVFLTESGDLKLLDFGIARLRDPGKTDENATAAGAMLGTPACMPPEQALGKWDEVDERADVYAIGATAFRMLTGKTVHEATSLPELLIAVATKPARSIRSVSAAVPAELAAVVDRALSFDRMARWPSAADMRSALAFARGPQSRMRASPLSDAVTTERTLMAPSSATNDWAMPLSTEPTTDRMEPAVRTPSPPVAGPTVLSPRSRTALMPHAKQTLASADGELLQGPSSADVAEGATKRLGPEMLGNVLSAIGESKRSKAQSATAALIAATSSPRRAGTIPMPQQLPSDANPDAQGPDSAATRVVDAPRAPSTELSEAPPHKPTVRTPRTVATQLMESPSSPPSPRAELEDQEPSQATRVLDSRRNAASSLASLAMPPSKQISVAPVAAPTGAEPRRVWLFVVVILLGAIVAYLVFRSRGG